MSPEEQKDVEALKAKAVEEKLKCYETMKHLATYVAPAKISNYGYKSVEEALVDTMKRNVATIEKMLRAHEKKWKD